MSDTTVTYLSHMEVYQKLVDSGYVSTFIVVDVYHWLNAIRALNASEDFEDNQIDCAEFVDEFLKLGYKVDCLSSRQSIESYIGSFFSKLDITLDSLAKLHYDAFNALLCICMQLDALGKKDTTMLRLHGLDGSGCRVFINDVSKAEMGDQFKPIDNSELFL